MTGLNVDRIRGQLDFPGTGRVVTDNAAGTQPPRELVELFRELTRSRRRTSGDPPHGAEATASTARSTSSSLL
jgi:hypothetical protein